MKRPITLRHSLACAISAAILLNTAPALADDTKAGGTFNQATPVDSTQQDRGINQPSSFGTDPAQRNDMENRTTSGDATRRGSDIVGDNPGLGSSSARRGALIDNADGTRHVQLSTGEGEDQLQSVVAKSLVDRKVVNLQNKTIGEVEEVVQGPEGNASLVVEAGGFMGIGKKEVLIPLDEVRLSGNQLIWESQMSSSQLKDSQQYRYEEDRYSSIADD